MKDEMKTNPSSDLISREDVIRLLVDKYKFTTSEATEILSELPSAVCDDCIWSVCNYNKVDWDTPSAEAEPKRVLQGYCKGADCKWWNPQVEGCNRCVFVEDEYTHSSAEAEPTVIRSKTLMPTKDFKEWAKRVREENPNAVIIPCDAEVVSADAVRGEWIPCSERLPDVDVEVLATVDWADVRIAWLKKGGTWETDEYILENDEILAWMPLPDPYKGGEEE